MGVGTVASAAEESPAEDFLVYDGVLDEYVGAGGDIVIPASLGVTEIAAQAFHNNTDITSVVIPEGVEIVGYWSFRGCENIEFIELPYSLEELAEHCFSSASIAEIVIPGNVEVVGYGAFSSCEYLEKVTISYGVKEIMVLAFGGCGVGDVIFPETVELICGGSFTNNKNANVGKAKMVICNPDCEIGGWTKDSSKDAYAHSWHGYCLPFSSNAAATRYDIYVPKGSDVANALNENIDKWNDADKAAGGSSLSGGHDSFDVKEKMQAISISPKTKRAMESSPPQRPMVATRLRAAAMKPPVKAALEALENKNKTIDANDPEALKAALAALENKDAE